jgi:predicted nucleic-acid-binding Zn-ribbon protein
MVTKKNKSIKKSKTASRKSKTQKGGRSSIRSPSIKYKKGNSESKKLDCTKCNGSSFIVKTLTMGTKTKAYLKLGILDNRFKVFTCTNCGFVQLYSNEIKCGGKECDPVF